MTPARERKAKERKARKEAGLVRVEMWVHKDRAAEVRALAAGWQPIETAPKDGTEIIAVFSKDYGFQSTPTVYGPWTVRFCAGSWVSSWDGCRVIESQGDTWTDYRDPDIEPTHWQPLPQPPDAQALTRGDE